MDTRDRYVTLYDCDSNKSPHLLARTVAIYVANRFAKQLREEDLIKCISSPTNSEYA